MYFKENWQSMAKKEPPFGHVDIFQTSPKHYSKEALNFSRRAFFPWFFRQPDKNTFPKSGYSRLFNAAVI
jgi:hypothetical protein